MAGSIVFDVIYDNKDKISQWAVNTFEDASEKAGILIDNIGNKANELTSEVGEARSGFFSDLGNAFGF